MYTRFRFTLEQSLSLALTIFRPIHFEDWHALGTAHENPVFLKGNHRQSQLPLKGIRYQKSKPWTDVIKAAPRRVSQLTEFRQIQHAGLVVIVIASSWSPETMMGLGYCASRAPHDSGVDAGSCGSGMWAMPIRCC